MANRMDGLMDSLLNTRRGLAQDRDAIEAQIAQIDTAIDAMQKVSGMVSKRGGGAHLTSQGRQNIADAARRRMARLKALGLTATATKEEENAAVQRLGLAVAS